MMRPILQTLAVACVLASGSARAICQDPANLVADQECMARELDKAERTMMRYFAAANTRASRGLDEPLDLAPAQAAWEGYRKQHCADVRRKWTGATHAARAQAMCEITLLSQRTHDLWAAYLTYVDRTPPVLPEPPLRP
jgi:uncharacterized protein YecT (DUF1311 family)